MNWSVALVVREACEATVACEASVACKAIVARLKVDPTTVVGIVGPTATGKTRVAIDTALQVGGEIVSCDSVQLYRKFDIGSGKPSDDERAKVVHHWIDTVDPLDPMDASLYAKMASATVDEIRARGKVPIVCGGSYLWAKALLQGLVEAPSADEEVRARHRVFVDEHGRAALHARLASVDPDSAGRLHPNDLVRVSRALEVYELTGLPMSVAQREHGFQNARYPSALFALSYSPDKLTERIQERAETWISQGWIDEVKRLLDGGLANARPMASVGYREVRSFVEGDLTRDELVPKIVQSTRIFARRQRTWLNHEKVEWLNP